MPVATGMSRRVAKIAYFVSSPANPGRSAARRTQLQAVQGRCEGDPLQLLALDPMCTPQPRHETDGCRDGAGKHRKPRDPAALER